MTPGKIRDKYCLITGANSGIGKKLSVELGRRGAKIIMVCRNREKGLVARKEVIAESGSRNIDLIVFDLSGKKSITEGISEIKEKYGRIDILINNAGVLLFKRELTGEGIEKTLATNYLGPFILTNEILEMNGSENPCRIINVVSEGTGDDGFNPDWPEGTGRYNGIKSYFFSKQAEIYFTFELAGRLKETGSKVNCFFPGLVRTNLGRPEKGLFLLTFRLMSRILQSKFTDIDEGIKPALFLLCSVKADGMNGCYLKRENGSIKVFRRFDKNISAELWDKTIDLLAARD